MCEAPGNTGAPVHGRSQAVTHPIFAFRTIPPGQELERKVEFRCEWTHGGCGSVGVFLFSVVLVSSSACDVINSSLLQVIPFQFFKAQCRCSLSRNLIWGPEFSSPASGPVVHWTCAWVMAGGTRFP